MNVEDINAELRPRSSWEAADLGVALARRDYLAILLRQALVMLPIWALLVLILHNHPGWVYILIWWTKPLFERISLFYLSRSLFGTKPKVGETLRAVPSMLFRNVLALMTVFRLSPSRSVFQPVTQLEGLHGSQYIARTSYLKHYGNTLGVTSVMVTLEMALAFALIAISANLLPFGVSVEWREVANLFFTLGWEDMSIESQWMLISAYSIAVFLLMPFYSAAGFGVYINARSILEGWDIELALKRLGQRISRMSSLSGGVGKAVSLVGISSIALAIAGPCSAQSDPNEAIDEVMSHPEFEIVVSEHEQREVDYTDYEDRGRSVRGPSGGMGDAIYYGLIIALCVGLALLIFFNRHAFFGRAKFDAAQTKARTVMGMEVSEESLPDDILAAARMAWAAGDYRKAVSLLYRGAICWLVEKGGVGIEESDTENECLARTERVLPGSSQFTQFSELTECWILQAYGGISPQDGDFHSLCENWTFSLKASSNVVTPQTSTDL